MLKEDCWVFLSTNWAKFKLNFGILSKRAKGFYMKGASKGFDWWDFKTNIWSWFSWLTPFLGPIAAFLLLLIFGPCIFNLLVKFVSFRIQQMNLQMVR